VTGRNGSILLVIICLINLIFSGCGSSAVSATGTKLSTQSTSLYPQVEEYIQQQMEADNIPGMAVVVVQGHEVIYLNGFGVVSLDTQQTVTPQTIFDLASVSKSFTALGVLLLRDEGLVELDASVRQYLSDFMPDKPQAAEITVRQLLNHTSGLPGEFSAPLIFQDGKDALQKIISNANRLKLNREPGSSFEYADINYCLLGALIEEVSGLTFEDYMQQKIFSPLGMGNTTLYPEIAAALDRADGHQPFYGGIIVRNIPVYRGALPAGWVMSCAEDIARWLIVHLNNGFIDGEQIIPAVTIEETHAVAVLYEEDGKKIGCGMGWLIDNSNEDISLVWHGGDTPNFTTDMLMLPQYETGIAVMINSQASTTGHNIAPAVANLVLGLGLDTMTVPWWAHWKMIDTMAIYGLIFVILLLLALLFYMLRIIWQLRAKKRHFFKSEAAGPRPPVWQMALYIAPLVLITMFIIASYLVVQTLFGYNLFEVAVLFRLGVPPGVYITGVFLIITVFLWIILLAIIALVTRGGRKQTKPQPVSGRLDKPA
jgi:CubicO group peptidase (beta-lactamase class C family)